MERPVRVRFAPSPTGPLHIGGIRTALYNYLFAKQKQGTFILRIEDTDQDRLVPGAEQYIVDSLAWIGIEPDEGPSQGGSLGPYRQSNRKATYQAYAQRLVDTGKAYYAFDTPQDLEAMRQRLQAAKVAAPQYNAISRQWMKNSLTLPAEEVAARLHAGEPYVIRCKLPPKETIRFYDQVRGWVKVETDTLDDKVLLKSDGMATYHLANIVDDYLMQITHVIRGEEWLPSAPLHVLLYQYFGWQDVMPQFVHLPLLLKPIGQGKLSKRDADEQGFPIFPIAWNDPATHTYTAGFLEKGYLPEALCNFLALLGWSPKGNQEIFSLTELIHAFSLERIGKSGVKFDIQKANWFNHHYLTAQPSQVWTDYLIKVLTEQHISYNPTQVEKVCELIKERAIVLNDFWKEGQIFFEPPTTYAPAVVEKRWTHEAVTILIAFTEALQQLPSFEAFTIKETLVSILEGQPLKLGDILPAVRLAVMGSATGPDLMESLEVMGQQEAVARLKKAVAFLGPGRR
jgi:glutamyl-tRNA synthetase